MSALVRVGRSLLSLPESINPGGLWHLFSAQRLLWLPSGYDSRPVVTGILVNRLRNPLDNVLGHFKGTRSRIASACQSLTRN